MPNQPDDTIAALRAISRACTYLADNATDIHALAHERVVSERVGSRSTAIDEIDTFIATGIAKPHSIGNNDAKRAWGHLAEQVLRAEKDLRAMVQQFAAIMGGPSAERTRGTYIRRADYKNAIEARSRRLERAADNNPLAEYEPHRNEPQPAWPGPRSKK